MKKLIARSSFLVPAVVMALGVTALVGCEKKAPTPAPAPTTTPKATTPEVKPEAKPETKPEAKPEAKAEAKPAAGSKKTYKFGVIAKSQSNPVFQAARVGAEDAAKELTKDGVTVTVDWRTPNDEDAQKQAQYVEQLVNSGIDGISISVTDAKVLNGAIDAAVAKGVPVVTFDSDAPESKRFATYGMDDVSAGEALGTQMAKALGDKGDKQVKGVVAILAGNQNATNLQARVRGVKNVLAQYPNVKVKDTYYHGETAAEAVAKVKQVQNSNPDITGWAMVGGWPLFTDKALDGVADKGVKVVAIDIVDTELVYVRNGQVQMLVGQNCYGWGNESVKMLYNFVHEGKKPANPVVRAPIDVVTKDNVEQFAGQWAKWLGKK